MDRLPPLVRHALFWAVIVVALLCVQALFARLNIPFWFRIAQLAGIGVIMAVSLNLVNGITGQFSIGHAGFQAVGAYAAATISVYVLGQLMPETAFQSPITAGAALVGLCLAGGLAAAVAGVLVGLPSLRLRGDYLAIVTLGFGEIIRVLILNIEEIGGNRGFGGADVLRGGSKTFVAIPLITTFFWIGLAAVLTIVVVRNLRFSTPGLLFLAVREDEVAADAMGINTTKTKLAAFTLSAFLAGIGGALYAHLNGFLDPASFGFLLSIQYVLMVVLGGQGSITGSVIAAVILTVLPELLRNGFTWLAAKAPQITQVAPNLSADVLRMLLYAFLLVLLMLTRPQGLFGASEVSLRGLFAGRRGRTPGKAV